MNLHERVSAFARLGDHLENALKNNELDRDLDNAYFENAWFTLDSAIQALKAVIDNFLDFEKIETWLERYNMPHENNEPKTVGIIMAGNIPLVGWQDLMCVLITGNRAVLKLSSKDTFLPKMMIRELVKTEPRFADMLHIIDEPLKNFDAIIATGSNNSLRYFEYYFGKYKHILRKNRNSVAVLTGNETEEELAALGHDIFDYYGLGCRNVSLIMVPEKYNFSEYFNALEPWGSLMVQSKYNNNYMYHKSLLLLNKEKHLDSGYLLMKDSPTLATPVSMINFTYYQSQEDVEAFLKQEEGNIQCVVAHPGMIEGSIGFGETQRPQLWDYPDGVDVIAFLLGL